MSTRASSDAQHPAYSVGVINYRTYDDLSKCLTSLAEQTLSPVVVVVVDSDPDETRLGVIEQSHPKVCFERTANLGYAGGANRALSLVESRAPRTEFCLILNADIILDPDFCRILLTTLVARPDVALASGKLLRPGREMLDSAGVRLPLNRRPRDRGSEQRDRGQFDEAEYVFGVSGAAMMLRFAAINDLAIDGEVFDEDFFLYHEDTDLSWRCQRMGWRVYYEPSAKAVHQRGWQSAHRYSIPVSVRRHSFKNHYLQIIKNESLSKFICLLPVLLIWEVARFGFALLKDRAVLPAYLDAMRLSGKAFRKRRLLRARAEERLHQ